MRLWFVVDADYRRSALHLSSITPRRTHRQPVFHPIVEQEPWKSTGSRILWNPVDKFNTGHLNQGAGGKKLRKTTIWA